MNGTARSVADFRPANQRIRSGSGAGEVPANSYGHPKTFAIGILFRVVGAAQQRFRLWRSRLGLVGPVRMDVDRGQFVLVVLEEVTVALLNEAHDTGDDSIHTGERPCS